MYVPSQPCLWKDGGQQFTLLLALVVSLTLRLTTLPMIARTDLFSSRKYLVLRKICVEDTLV